MVSEEIPAGDLVKGDYRVGSSNSEIRITEVTEVNDHEVRVVYQWTSDGFDRSDNDHTYSKLEPWNVTLIRPADFVIPEAVAFTEENT